MVQTTNLQTSEKALKNKIITLYQYFFEQSDQENAEKVKQLARKLEHQEFVIAFCGHFSAGKSTMINKVIGDSILPSSPIPTSANLVKVRSGEDYAKVFFKNEKPRLYLAPYDYQLVKNYCKDGDQIKEIEISHSDTELPENTVIMDTPGIDSTDDAHRIATESALHLADMIFYVMDYNHVQAELNFLFTKELSEAGKEVYLVINQIDKHNHEELSFEEFKKSVKDSFATWGVRPARIFYTSLKQENHVLNEFKDLQQFIAESMAKKGQTLQSSIEHSLYKLAEQHMDQARRNAEETNEHEIEIIKHLTESEEKQLTESYQIIRMSLNTIAGNLKKAEEVFDEQTSQIIKNAYLMPSPTRELAEPYLESLQPGFKVGMFFSKQKTDLEKSNRLERFYQDVLDKTKSQLEWHLRQFFLLFLKEREIDEGEVLAKAQSFKLEVPKDLLESTIKPGARVSGEYVLVYTDDLANELKRLARRKTLEFKATVLDALTSQAAKLKERDEEELHSIEKYVYAIEKIKKLNDELAGKEKEVQDLFLHDYIQTDSYQVFHQPEEEFEVVKGEALCANSHTVLKEAAKDPLAVVHQEEVAAMETGRLKQMVSKLHKSSKLVENLPGFTKLAKELDEKAARLSDKGFTVALFGAFSAGKSSFANALMGEKVLPVSPNPTTAAINKIKPVTEQYPHGTVLVKFKESGAMLEDINRSLKVFDLHAGDFRDSLNKIEQIMIGTGKEGVLEKTHYAFLNAFKKGYETFVKQLGMTKETDIGEFSEFVAREERSCYVEWIELYYDCELTRKGITLVDTPGADSINARHTGVAFDYIKNSDAILFVTYYNHAFSKADREFLIQLGRVKDSFQMDKMFFIINAIDLAENNEEKQIVADYVKDQLIKYGIRNPHLYCLSSLLALKEKEDGSFAGFSGMGEFEQSFYRFISSDLTEMAVTSAENELKRLQELLEKLIQSSMEDQSIKAQKRIEMEQQRALISHVFNEQKAENMLNRLLQESEELNFYIKQRVFLRFSDFFKEAFNPSTLRDDGRNLKKALQTALDEFLESLGFDFAQEMRATTVRLDRFTEKILKDSQMALIRSLQEINKDLSFSEFEMGKTIEIDFENAFQSLDPKTFTKALSYFKNPKAFFEKNEKKLMSEELLNVLNAPADEYLRNGSTRLNEHYTVFLTKEFDLLIHRMAEEADNVYTSLQSTLDGGIPLEDLRMIQESLTAILK